VSKLTLSVDEEVIEQAKSWAAREGTSVSHLVERFLREAAASGEAPAGTAPPVLRRLRGCLTGLDVEAHRRHLETKYR
jgi:antitoxin component of RelBE/YafQ-DinJ toxin-antitoxin module